MAGTLNDGSVKVIGRPVCLTLGVAVELEEIIEAVELACEGAPLSHEIGRIGYGLSAKLRRAADRLDGRVLRVVEAAAKATGKEA